MKKTNKSTFDGLPDEMVLHILSKISDLKTLCICQLVSMRFYETVLQVEAISFTSAIDSIEIPPNMELDESVSITLLVPFEFAMLSLNKFKRVKSFNIQLLSSSNMSNNDPSLFKWIFKFNDRLNRLLFLAADYVCHRGEIYLSDDEDCMALRKPKYKTVSRCIVEARIIHSRLLQCCIENFPLLENISITDLGKRRVISYNGKEIIALRNILTLPYEIFKREFLGRAWQWHFMHVRLLKLPISGYLMDEATVMVLKRDDLHDSLRLLWTGILDDDGFVGDEEEEALHDEAISEILEQY